MSARPRATPWWGARKPRPVSYPVASAPHEIVFGIDFGFTEAQVVAIAKEELQKRWLGLAIPPMMLAGPPDFSYAAAEAHRFTYCLDVPDHKKAGFAMRKTKKTADELAHEWYQRLAGKPTEDET